MRITKNYLERHPETRQELEATGKWVGDYLEIPSQSFTVTKTRPFPVWPQWAEKFKARFQPGDRGLGDVIEREAGIFGSERFTVWHRSVFGDKRPCPNCPALWNRLYPIPAATAP